MTRGLTSSEKALNGQKTPAKNSRKNNLKNTAAFIASSIAIVLGTTGCEGAAKKYRSWEAKQEIAVNKAEIYALIEQYNDYFTDYEKCFDDMVALQAAGDIGGYKKVLKKREKLEKRIKEIENKIDKKSMKTLDLSDKFYKGKQKAEEEKARNTSSFGDNQPVKLQRRTFLEDRE